MDVDDFAEDMEFEQHNDSAYDSCFSLPGLLCMCVHARICYSIYVCATVCHRTECWQFTTLISVMGWYIGSMQMCVSMWMMKSPGCVSSQFDSFVEVL